MVDKALITKKLERVGSYLEQVHKKKDPGMAGFLKDRDIQSIILFNLIQAIQSCIDIGAHVISDSQWETPATQAELFEIIWFFKGQGYPEYNSFQSYSGQNLSRVS